MNTYIVFPSDGGDLDNRYTLLIAPCDEKYYRGSTAELVTETAVEPAPCENPHIRAIHLVNDRETAICRRLGSYCLTRRLFPLQAPPRGLHH
jgi:hypothetical protein